MVRVKLCHPTKFPSFIFRNHTIAVLCIQVQYSLGCFSVSMLQYARRTFEVADRHKKQEPRQEENYENTTLDFRGLRTPTR